MSPAALSNPARKRDDAASTLAQLFAPGRPLVMGVLNVTPDSFSDGGRFLEPTVAIDHARRMVDEGADLLDIGAESTRPYGGAMAVAQAEEMRRLEPVLPQVVALGVPVSIDTIKAEVAAAAIAAGAAIVNDVWGLQRDPDMAHVVASRDVPVVIMHNREAVDPALDIMADIERFFARSLAIAEKAGIPRERMVLDPGIGFGKTPEQSLTAIARFGELKSFGLPLMIGASRKRFIDKVSPAPPDRRIGGSLAAHLAAVAAGAAIVRTHDVAETVQALRVAAAIASAR
jgi:dihydropteroate synthase